MPPRCTVQMLDNFIAFSLVWNCSGTALSFFSLCHTSPPPSAAWRWNYSKPNLVVALANLAKIVSNRWVWKEKRFSVWMRWKTRVCSYSHFLLTPNRFMKHLNQPSHHLEMLNRTGSLWVTNVAVTCCPSRCFLIFFGRRFQAIQIYAGGAESPHQRVHPLVVRIRSVFGLWRQKDHSHRATTDPTSGCSGMDDDDSYCYVGGRHWIFDQLPTMEFGYLFGYLVWLWCCYDGFLHRNWRWNGQILICTWHAKQECFLFFVTAVTFSLHLRATRKNYANIYFMWCCPWNLKHALQHSEKSSSTESAVRAGIERALIFT